MCGGKWDLALNTLGLSQAESAQKKLEKHNLDFQNICVSPLTRARQTAEFFARAYPRARLVVVEELREWDMGEWEKRLFVDVRMEFLGTGSPKGGENRDELKNRVGRALTCVDKLPGLSLVVAHGGVWVALMAWLNLPAVRIENCHIKRVFSPGVGPVEIESID